MGRNEEALEACDRLLTIKIENAEGWILKGIALYELGRFSEAISAYDHALMVDPRHAKGILQ
jgi:Flp pilus assembly protein TadD